MKKIIGIMVKNGDFKRINGTEIFKGNNNQYVSKFYKKGYNTGLGMIISNYWQVNANKDNYEDCKGCFSHWD